MTNRVPLEPSEPTRQDKQEEIVIGIVVFVLLAVNIPFTFSLVLEYLASLHRLVPPSCDTTWGFKCISPLEGLGLALFSLAFVGGSIFFMIRHRFTLSLSLAALSNFVLFIWRV